MTSREDLSDILSPFLNSMRKLEMKLKCPVCNNLLQGPKFLRCDHIICQNCLPAAVDGKRPTCPKCGKIRAKDARSSLYMEEMIIIFNEMDDAIYDVFCEKASTCEDIKTEAVPLICKERGHGSDTNTSYKTDEADMFGSATNTCNEGKFDASGTTHESKKRKRGSKSSQEKFSPAGGSFHTKSLVTEERERKGEEKEKEREEAGTSEKEASEGQMEEERKMKKMKVKAEGKRHTYISIGSSSSDDCSDDSMGLEFIKKWRKI